MSHYYWLRPISLQRLQIKKSRNQHYISLSLHVLSTRQEIRIKKKYQLGNWLLIQYQILQTNIVEIVWQTVRRITDGILDHVLDCLEKSLYPNQTFNYLCQNIIN